MLLGKIMSKSSFNRVYLYYDFLEKYIIRDYKIALELIHNNLNLNKNLNVVDIGGGTGAIAKSIIDEVNSVWIVDNSKQMLKRLKNPIITNIQCDAFSLPIKDRVFDIALLINVLHHIKKVEQMNVLKEIFRILKNQGEAFIIDLYFPKTFINRIFSKPEEILVGRTCHIPHNELMSKLKDAGFKNFSFNFIDKHKWRYLIIAKK